MTNGEIYALTTLLDDPDSLIYDQVERKMISIGKEIVPILENTWKNTRNMLVQTRIEHIVDTINFQKIESSFEAWNKSNEPDLLDAMMIINGIQYPNVDCRTYYNVIEDKVREIWLELNDNLTAFEKVNVINKVLFEIWNFRSVNESSYDSFQYNFLSNLMELKCGNQFSIACLYLVLAEKLDLPIYPVLLEDQLILTYAGSHRPVDEIDNEDILFYINPNENGIVFDEHSIKAWLQKHELENNADYYLPVSTKSLVSLYIGRLIMGYQEEQDNKKVRLLSTLKV